jgi:hypothetical protein
MKMKTNEIGYLCYYLQFGLAPGFNMKSVADITTTTQVTVRDLLPEKMKSRFRGRNQFF